MLPKVATQILHQTTRAVAAVQSQTSHTIRNVLQSNTSTNLGPWNGPGSSSSNWGGSSYGPGPGGSKYNAGSRFYNGYTGAGRAISQANVIATQDASVPQSDDNDELAARRTSLHRRPKNATRTRTRSHSLSLNVQDRHDRGETLGVLRTVQIHARSRHAFAQVNSVDSPLLITHDPTSGPDTPRPSLARRNSTSVPSQCTDSIHEPPLVSVASTPPQEPLLSTDPAAPQTVTPPELPPASSKGESSSLEESDGYETFIALREARDKGDSSNASVVVANFVANARHPSVAEFNMALEALHEKRRPGEPLTQVLETYNAMLTRSLLPNIRTYCVLILALTDRDHEVHRMIQSLSLRTEKRFMASPVSGQSPYNVEETRIKNLQLENNFGSAMSLFQAAIALDGNHKIPGSVYNNLLRSCSYHASVDNAIHVFAQLEQRKDVRPSAVSFLHMLSTFTNAGQLQGVQDVFKEFINASKEDRIAWTLAPTKRDDKHDITQRTASSRNVQIQIWNKMIEACFRCQPPSPVAGINVLEEMLNSPAQPLYGFSDVPPPASSTYTTVINGFITCGDLESALRWFDHLLAQNLSPRNPFESSKQPLRPDLVAWMAMFDALARAAESDGRVDDLNRIFKIFCESSARDGYEVRPVDRQIVHRANMAALLSLGERVYSLEGAERQKVKDRLDFVVDYIWDDSLHRMTRRDMLLDIGLSYTKLGFLLPPMNLLKKFVSTELGSLEQTNTLPDAPSSKTRTFLQTTVARFLGEFLAEQSKRSEPIPFAAVMELTRVSDSVRFLPTVEGPESIGAVLLHSYGVERQRGQVVVELGIRDWELLLYAATELDLPKEDGSRPIVPIEGFAFAGTTSLLEDLATRNVDFDHIQRFIVRRVIQAVYVTHGAEELRSLFVRLGPSYERSLNAPQRDMDALAESIASSPNEASTSGIMDVEPGFATGAVSLKIDSYTSQWVDETLQLKRKHKSDPFTAFTRFDQSLQKGSAPGPAVLARLIQSLGREGEVDKVRQVYNAAQGVLRSLAFKKEWQSQAWFHIEDSMIIALAHAGDLDSAHVHRMRILEQGGAPTADAYGALILHVKDTTDDTSNSMALFQESQMQGVPMNLYLYNNIISKLAKARKADHALELFQEMKTSQIRPSSITYGALIGACARVGDAQSAEILFEEMTTQQNYKPRIPPFNTMMQLYTTTKQNRERALFYYDALLKAGIAPTAHTYKLLLDAYGTIEPVDLQAMQDVFRNLEANHSIPIQGPHWTSLINSYGCVGKDLEKAIEIFDSIPSHPRSSEGLPDAVVFEAMINVLVAHRRTDLMPLYMEKMNASGIHMTAYIANCLIKGYATMGDLEQARAIFESLQDPPEGVAAPNNHAPHEPAQAPNIEPMAPVYREPSTWEVMVRAELGAGNRDRAMGILERLHARQYPEAVYNRISGIMLDQSSASPWG